MIETQYFSDSHDAAANRGVADFVSLRIWGEPDRFRDDSTMGVFRGERLIAGVVYHVYDPTCGTCQVSAASVDKIWMTRPVLFSMFNLPFNLLGCQMVIHQVSEHNARHLRQMRAFGFSEYVVPRLLGRHETGHVFTLTDDAWRQNRFLPKRVCHG